MGKASENLSKMLALCAHMDVAKLAEQYNICAEVTLEDEDRDSQRIGLNIAKAVDAIGYARFPTSWEAVRDQQAVELPAALAKGAA